MDPGQLHRRIAVIFQDFARYQLTARENIGFGAVNRSTSYQRSRSPPDAGADPYLAALPEGYETILSPEYDGGRELSVGQWQRGVRCSRPYPPEVKELGRSGATADACGGQYPAVIRL